MKPGSPKPFFKRVAELLGQMDIDGRKVEKTPDYMRPPWYTDDGKSLDWSLCKMRKGTPNEIFRIPRTCKRKIQRPHKDLQLHRRKKEEKVGYAFVIVHQ
jgi:hypothetical protein